MLSFIEVLAKHTYTYISVCVCVRMLLFNDSWALAPCRCGGTRNVECSGYKAQHHTPRTPPSAPIAPVRSSKESQKPAYSADFSTSKP